MENALRRIAIMAAISLSGCVVPETQEGSVYQFNGETVTIRGVYDMTLSGKPAAPTAAMVAQAKAVCPGATYLSANPSPSDDYTFLYLFRC
jgi:hypothetical protein